MNNTTIDLMWQRLAAHQTYANKYGYAHPWASMCATRTLASIRMVKARAQKFRYLALMLAANSILLAVEYAERKRPGPYTYFDNYAEEYARRAIVMLERAEEGHDAVYAEFGGAACEIDVQTVPASTSTH